MPSAEIVAIGTELLLGDIVDSNSQALGKALAEFGIVHLRRTAVGDNLARCTDAISEALQRSNLVLTIGGLGPTPDDLTRDAVSNAVGEPLVVDEAYLTFLKQYVASRGRAWNESYSRQSMRPESAVLITNEVGSAPGIHWAKGDKQIVAMPGPRGEFLAMLATAVRPLLRAMSDSVIYSRTVRVLDVSESVIAEMFAKEMERENPTLSPYAKVGEVHLRVTARAETVDAAQHMVDPVTRQIVEKLGGQAYSSDGKDLVEVLMQRLVETRATLAVAESCTGGMLGSALTQYPGASDVFVGGVIAYSNETKVRLIDVDRDALDEHGAVSEQVCKMMAEGVRHRMQTTYGIGITGVAGPTGGSAEKPVGLVYVATASPNGTCVRELRIRGGRDQVREASVQGALAQLYWTL